MIVLGHVVTGLDALCGATVFVVLLIWLQTSAELAALRKRIRSLEARLGR